MTKGRFVEGDWHEYGAEKTAASEVSAAPVRPEAKAEVVPAPALTPTS